MRSGETLAFVSVVASLCPDEFRDQVVMVFQPGVVDIGGGNEDGTEMVIPTT